MKTSLIKLLLIIIILLFISTYYIANSGYYEYRLQERTILTNDKIKEFENDIKNNENIDIKDYLPKEDIDYTNNISNTMYNISNKFTNITRKCMKYVFKKINYLIKD